MKSVGREDILLFRAQMKTRINNVKMYQRREDILLFRASVTTHICPGIKHLPGYERPWITRFMRFHMTSISGTLLTFFISFSLIYKFNVIHEVAQAVAILLVLFYNFAAHHLFNYRRVETALVN